VGVSEGTAFFVFKHYGLNAPMGLLLSTFLRVRNIALSFLIAPFAFVGRGRGGGPGEPVAAGGPDAATAELQTEPEAEPESTIDRASAS